MDTRDMFTALMREVTKGQLKYPSWNDDGNQGVDRDPGIRRTSASSGLLGNSNGPYRPPGYS